MKYLANSRETMQTPVNSWMSYFAIPDKVITHDLVKTWKLPRANIVWNRMRNWKKGNQMRDLDSRRAARRDSPDRRDPLLQHCLRQLRELVCRITLAAALVSRGTSFPAARHSDAILALHWPLTQAFFTLPGTPQADQAKHPSTRFWTGLFILPFHPTCWLQEYSEKATFGSPQDVVYVHPQNIQNDTERTNDLLWNP